MLFPLGYEQEMLKRFWCGSEIPAVALPLHSLSLHLELLRPSIGHLNLLYYSFWANSQRVGTFPVPITPVRLGMNSWCEQIQWLLLPSVPPEHQRTYPQASLFSVGQRPALSCLVLQVLGRTLNPIHLTGGYQSPIPRGSLEHLVFLSFQYLFFLHLVSDINLNFGRLATAMFRVRVVWVVMSCDPRP